MHSVYYFYAVYSGEKTITSLTCNEWEIMQCLLCVLKMLRECTKTCSKPNSCILEVIPIVCVLQRFLKKDDVDQSGGMKTTRAELLKALTTQFESRTMDKNVLLATAVDPRFKLKFLDSESHAVLMRETNCLKPTDNKCTLVVPAAEIHEKTAKAQNHDDLWACFDEINDHDEVDREQSVNNDVTSEVSAFLALPLQPRFVSICMVAYKLFIIPKPFPCCVEVRGFCVCLVSRATVTHRREVHLLHTKRTIYYSCITIFQDYSLNIRPVIAHLR